MTLKSKLDVILALVAALIAATVFLYVRGWGWTPATLVGAAIGVLTYTLVGTVRRLGRIYRKD